VFLEAFVPVDGMSMFDLMPAAMRHALESAAQDGGAGWRMPPVPLERLGGLGSPGVGVDVAEGRSLLSRRGPHPIGTYRERSRVTNPAARVIPRTYIACTEHPAGDPMAAIAARMRAAGVPVLELPTGHFPMLTMPVELAGILEGTSRR
jgi:hypothetical protein